MKERILKFLLDFLRLFGKVLLVMITIIAPPSAFIYFLIALFTSKTILIGALKIFVITPTILVIGIMTDRHANTLGIWDKIYDYVKEW